MNRIVTVFLAGLVVLGTLPATGAAQPSKDQLKSQFKAREAELHDLKKNGVVGETVDGYVDVVPGAAGADGKAGAVVSDENKDRRLLYQILADEINKEHPDDKVRATMETIATRNALRNMERAGPDESLRVAKDYWIRVKDYPRYQKLGALKARGRVGETGAGMVEIVKPEDRSDKAVEAIVNEENSVRAAEYKAMAEKERSSATGVAAKMAKRNFENAKVGEMLKDEGGAWRKK